MKVKVVLILTRERADISRVAYNNKKRACKM